MFLPRSITRQSRSATSSSLLSLKKVVPVAESVSSDANALISADDRGKNEYIATECNNRNRHAISKTWVPTESAQRVEVSSESVDLVSTDNEVVVHRERKKRLRASRWGPVNTEEIREDNVKSQVCQQIASEPIEEVSESDSSAINDEDNDDGRNNFLVSSRVKTKQPKHIKILTSNLSTIAKSSDIDVSFTALVTTGNGCIGDEEQEKETCTQDEKGYYLGRISEVLNGRFRIVQQLGKGVFANVFRCIDLNGDERCEVAIKIIRDRFNPEAIDKESQITTTIEHENGEGISAASNDSKTVGQLESQPFGRRHGSENFTTTKERDIGKRELRILQHLHKGIPWKSSSLRYASARGLNSETSEGWKRSNNFDQVEDCEENKTEDGSEYFHTSNAYSSNIIGLYQSFQHFRHRCLVLEALSMNLRAYCRLHRQSQGTIAKKQLTVGLPLKTVKSFGRQLFDALGYIHSLGFIHADIKPDNILVDSTFQVVKICDFGAALTESDLEALNAQSSSSPLTDMDNTYIAARLYRAPEVALDYHKKTAALDVWAMGCSLAELCRSPDRGTIFKGMDNNQLLWSIMGVMGVFPKRMIAGSKRGSLYFRERTDGVILYRRIFRDDVDQLSAPKSASNLSGNEFSSVGVRDSTNLEGSDLSQRRFENGLSASALEHPPSTSTSLTSFSSSSSIAFSSAAAASAQAATFVSADNQIPSTAFREEWFLVPPKDQKALENLIFGSVTLSNQGTSESTIISNNSGTNSGSIGSTKSTFLSLLSGLLTLDPERRLSANIARKHVFFAD